MQKFNTTILFDLDGTLIDSTSAILEGFAYAFSKMGEACPDDEAIKKLIGYPLDEIFAGLGVVGDTSEYVRLYKEKYVKIYLDQTTLLQSAYEAVEFGAKFANLGVVTTKTSKFSKLLLDKLGVGEFFSVIIGREDVEHVKPHAEPIINAMKGLGLPVDKSVFMVGDTKLDALAASNAGARSVGVMCGYGDEAQLRKHCEFVCENAYAAVSLIKQNL
ncbi:HAD family hydrolase [Campylobacter sp. JMF_01 NE2]|uniref:HAD family hydrolase n=1 Tax=unclassified Campylobacter TaxID=2593542 RepID=UPI001B68D124|nr:MULTISPECIES: HAD family hydrolase [unclassified Campylobacter]MBP3224675.1 HAD family hydrolase [Campylobacter sp.]MDA3043145.1 HAD family hydrolase [Campylobacter sp. JMF_09 ED2]MDA3044817.1 HAD family hydrolase [Campylobacter sp. JMF_07 ED4]MDA3047449.1 HAD family hydrolase [Campylobacter sp. JMF_08 NE1]MDA3049688.1 HAD family hydrolase [Campylobacter sp. JMF_15 NE4]